MPSLAQGLQTQGTGPFVHRQAAKYVLVCVAPAPTMLLLVSTGQVQTGNLRPKLQETSVKTWSASTNMCMALEPSS